MDRQDKSVRDDGKIQKSAAARAFAVKDSRTMRKIPRRLSETQSDVLKKGEGFSRSEDIVDELENCFLLKIRE
ncbi:hypothetical protein NPIL_210821 [Nephila pilipes]|uniref:Uncharacterized protein n=1 Tax=Nephila pilipes TaxID=299642 RepID=A0A8X6Q8T9_NEPPI|nr:hypothetical protein NPIL_210821 [Nephila pilipes]